MHARHLSATDPGLLAGVIILGILVISCACGLGLCYLYAKFRADRARAAAEVANAAARAAADAKQSAPAEPLASPRSARPRFHVSMAKPTPALPVRRAVEMAKSLARGPEPAALESTTSPRRVRLAVLTQSPPRSSSRRAGAAAATTTPTAAAEKNRVSARKASPERASAPPSALPRSERSSFIAYLLHQVIGRDAPSPPHRRGPPSPPNGRASSPTRAPKPVLQGTASPSALLYARLSQPKSPYSPKQVPRRVAHEAITLPVAALAVYSNPDGEASIHSRRSNSPTWRSSSPPHSPPNVPTARATNDGNYESESPERAASRWGRMPAASAAWSRHAEQHINIQIRPAVEEVAGSSGRRTAAIRETARSPTPPPPPRPHPQPQQPSSSLTAAEIMHNFAFGGDETAPPGENESQPQRSPPYTSYTLATRGAEYDADPTDTDGGSQHRSSYRDETVASNRSNPVYPNPGRSLVPPVNEEFFNAPVTPNVTPPPSMRNINV